MNTQLEDRTGTETLPEAHFSRPQPVWGDKTPTQPPAPAPQRSRRWIAVLVTVVMAGAAALAVWAITSDSSTTEPTPRAAFDSPGGNSLVIPAVGVPVEAPAFDSPGGNSLNIP